jgi:NAD(P)-dependent dehydrogenase (short-subunit alcohol dehydrogenase family)
MIHNSPARNHGRGDVKIFRDKVAVITGGASGIGRALGQALVEAGAVVVLADNNGPLCAETARALGERAHAVVVDVTDAAQVARAIEDTVATHGRIDYLFNNAGIAIIGEASAMTLADWDRIVDVNLRGVVHGVAAAYPIMIRQGHGHIVNTASLAGLLPSPHLAAYAATKHAVVGLSVSLRVEAATHGVNVTAICPGFIDTPLKDNAKLLGLDRDRMLEAIPSELMSADDCARHALRGVAKNRPIVLVTRLAKVAHWLHRFWPGATHRLAALQLDRTRKAAIGAGAP